VFVGLYRLQNIQAAAAAVGSGYFLTSFVGVRAAGVSDVYASLRRIDAGRDSTRSGGGDYRRADSGTCVVLDFSTAAALATILRQVNRSLAALSSASTLLLKPGVTVTHGVSVVGVAGAGRLAGDG